MRIQADERGRRMLRWAREGARLLAVVALVAGTPACKSKDDAVATAPSATALAPSEAPPKASLKLTIDPASTSSIDMPAPDEHIKAETSAAQGSIVVDVSNLTQSRGEVKIDLTTLVTKTFDSASKNQAQTVHARTWLEVADGEEGKLPDDVKNANRYAQYAIRSIDGIAEPDLAKVAVTKDGADDVRTVAMTTHGELLVHGHKVVRDVPVEAAFHYDPGAPADKPKLVVVRTQKPMRVVLAEHDVKPRDGLGKIAKGAFQLLGTKVADVADVSLNLRARP